MAARRLERVWSGNLTVPINDKEHASQITTMKAMTVHWVCSLYPLVQSKARAAAVAGRPATSAIQKTRCSCFNRMYDYSPYFSESAVKGAAAESQRFSGVPGVAVEAHKRLLNQQPLHLFEAHFLKGAGRAGAFLQAQIAHSHRIGLGHDDGPFHQMVQFPNVARPGMGGETCRTARQIPRGACGSVAGVGSRRTRPGRECPHGGRAAGADGFDGVEANSRSARTAACPILSLPQFADLVAEMTRTSTSKGLGGTDSLEVAGFDGAQELGLMLEGDIGDFIQEQRSAIGQFKAADAIGLGIGERAFDVAEDLAFKDPFREPAGIDRHQGFPGSV